MSEVENRLRRRWESMPPPICADCHGDGEIESGWSAIPWHRGPTITCPECHGSGTLTPSFENWLDQLPATDPDIKEWNEP